MPHKCAVNKTRHKAIGRHNALWACFSSFDHLTISTISHHVIMIHAIDIFKETHLDYMRQTTDEHNTLVWNTLPMVWMRYI